MRTAAYVGGLLGLGLLCALLVRADLTAMAHTFDSAGRNLLWLVPYRLLFFVLYAIGWLYLLRPNDPEQRAGLGYLLWVTTIREAVDRLLPVASVGGSVVGIRLVRWRGLAAVPVSASVVVEIALTLIASYVFTSMGLLLLLESNAVHEYRRWLMVFVLSSPVPIVTVILLRYGSVFVRLHRWLGPLIGTDAMSASAASLDQELRASLARGWTLTFAGTLQLAALISGSFEIWFTMRLFGHPVNVATSLILESMTQAIRHAAFAIPAALGVQEAGLMLFGYALGINGELALSVSMAKRMREVLCGLPSLISWQWMEVLRLRNGSRNLC